MTANGGFWLLGGLPHVAELEEESVTTVERADFRSAVKNLGLFSFNCSGRDAATPPALLLAAIGGAETEQAQLPAQLPRAFEVLLVLPAPLAPPAPPAPPWPLPARKTPHWRGTLRATEMQLPVWTSVSTQSSWPAAPWTHAS